MENINNDPIKSLPTKEYIIKTVEKELTEGLFIISQQKPTNPIEFLGQFLIQKSQEKKNKNN